MGRTEGYPITAPDLESHTLTEIVEAKTIVAQFYFVDGAGVGERSGLLLPPSWPVLVAVGIAGAVNGCTDHCLPGVSA